MKLIKRITLFFLCIALISWGRLGHKTIGVIAERHLTERAKAAIHDLIGDSSLADIANWADDIRGSDQYKATGPWHYINLPAGLSKPQFEKMVTEMSEPNVYRELNDLEGRLASSGSSIEERRQALRFIVHFVGDIHQPMHVSRAEDQGGNKIQVNYEGRGTNLHALWDSRLLEHEALTDDALANKIDKATPGQVAQWQQDPLIDWMWESYQISSVLYGEVEAMNNRTITDEYYQNHIGIIEERLEKAGVRLAGVLNRILSKSTWAKTNFPAPVQANSINGNGTVKTVQLQDIASHMGENVRVCGKVYSEKAFPAMILVNLGAAFPDQLLTVVLKGDAKNKWTEGYTGNICVKGKVIDYKGKPEINVSAPGDVSIQ